MCHTEKRSDDPDIIGVVWGWPTHPQIPLLPLKDRNDIGRWRRQRTLSPLVDEGYTWHLGQNQVLRARMRVTSIGSWQRRQASPF